jgi:hypothetical protein
MEDNIYYVYSHLNPNTYELFYIGIGTGKRSKEYKAGRSTHYINYIKKHGKPIDTILHNNISLTEACRIEVELINKYGRVGYELNGILINKSKGGEGGNKGVKQSEETRNKKRKAMLGKSIHSSNQKQIWSKTRAGKSTNWDPNHIKADKGRSKPFGFDNKQSHPLEQYDLNGNYIKTWDNMKSIYKVLNIRSANIYSHLTGKTKQAGGYKWKSIK